MRGNPSLVHLFLQWISHHFQGSETLSACDSLDDFVRTSHAFYSSFSDVRDRSIVKHGRSVYDLVT